MEAEGSEIQEVMRRAAGLATRNSQIFWTALMLYPFTLLFGYVGRSAAISEINEALIREAYRTDKNIIFAASPNRDSGEPPQILDLGCGTDLFGSSLCQARVIRSGQEKIETWAVPGDGPRLILRGDFGKGEERRVVFLTPEK